jgi:hypothetical protein
MTMATVLAGLVLIIVVGLLLSAAQTPPGVGR